MGKQITGDHDFDDLLNKCLEIMDAKGEDYTIGTGDRLHNFKTVGQFIGMTHEQVLGVYAYKHISAIFNYIKSDGASQSEPIDGRIADLVNYMLLLYKMIKTKEREKDPHKLAR